MTTLIIARHGNTFEADEAPRRVGLKTDLPLTEKGLEQGRAIGRYLKEHRLIPDVVYASTLQRTQQTAREAIRETGVTNPVFPLEIFDEIDYGPDENRLEDEVIARIGEEALQKWDDEAVPPDGWIVSPDEIIQNLVNFAEHIRQHDDDETVLVVTSNGIARFAPHITGDFEGFRAQHNIKLSTGAISVFRFEDGVWRIKEWNLKP